VYAEYPSGGQVLEFAEQADQLVLIAEILERMPSEVIKEEAFQKWITIATSKQDHLRDRRKTNVNDLVKVTTKMLEKDDERILLLGFF
jgi:hypothetical protein